MPTRLILEIAAALAIAGGVWWYSAHERAIGEAKQQAKYEALLKIQADKVAKAEATARQITEDKDRERQAQNQELQSRIDDLLAHPHVVRIKSACDSAEARISTSASEPHAASEGSGQTLRDGEDLGRQLIVFAGQCESDRQQVIALQGWITAQRSAWTR